MNEIRQLCTTSPFVGKHLDEILALFHACPPQHLLPSLSLIGQSISCMSINQLDLNLINHPIFLLIRQWSERLLQLWLINGTLNGEEYRAIFYIHQLFKLLSEWFVEEDLLMTHKKNEQEMKVSMRNLFLEENFLQTLSEVIHQLINHENIEQHSILTNQSSTDDVHLQTQTSDIQAEHADVLDVLFRCVNSLLILYNHRYLIKRSSVEQILTPCVLNVVNSSLFLQLATQFLRQHLSSDKINIQSIFLLFTCLDHCTLSAITPLTFQFLPYAHQILQIWCETSPNSNEDVSPLIVRLIYFINQLALADQGSIIEENLCAFLLPNFELLCQTPTLVDVVSSLFVTLCSTNRGKQYLRQLGVIQYILHHTKHHVQLWQPLALLITQEDFSQVAFFKRFIHLLIQRTRNTIQSLTSASNDTSFDSISPSSRNQLIVTAIEWFALLHQKFLSFTMIVEEIIHATKKIHLMNLLIDMILSLQQEEETLPRLTDSLIELLWTFSFSSSTDIHEHLQKRLDLCQWLKGNMTNATPRVRIASQAILSTVVKTSIRGTLHRRWSNSTTNLICLINTDESYHELCITLRDRLQIEHGYSVELLMTPSCLAIDSLLYHINRSLLCLFCASTRMKSDNLAHFLYHYISTEAPKTSLLTTVIELDCELEGNWLGNIPLIEIDALFRDLGPYLHCPHDPPSSTTIENQSRDYRHRSISYWSADDVKQWCEATEGNFDTLRPLVKRLNGPALVNLAEILSIEPASMYHSLNDELLQRTGTSVPLTEYVSLRSELQRLMIPKPNEHKNPSKRKLWKKSRFCSLL